MQNPLRLTEEQADRARRIAESGMMALAATSIAVFAKFFCKTLKLHDGHTSKQPFPCYVWSQDFYTAFQNGDDILWEKSRQMMATWTVAIALVWAAIFRYNHNYLVISQKEELVHDKKRTTNSILGKCEYIIANLPVRWRLQFEVQHMVIYNKRTKTAIKGEPTNANAGRSGAWNAIFLDEAAHNKHGEDIYGACASACYGPFILLSTPHPHHDIGEDVFSRLRWMKNCGGMTLLTTPWHMHPDRQCNHGPDDPHLTCWYAKEIEKLTDRQRAAEMDIEYGGSKTGRCFYPWDRSLFTGPVSYIPGMMVWRGWDFGVGRTAVVLCHVKWIRTLAGNNLPQVTIFDYLEDGNQDYKYYRKILGGWAEEYTDKSRCIDYGDPWMLESRESDLMSWKKNLERTDIEDLYPISVAPSPCRGVSIPNLIQNVCKFMRIVTDQDGKAVPLLIVSNTNPRCERIIMVIERYSFPTDDAGNVIDKKPIKNIFSHGADAFQYIAWKISPIQDIGRFIDDASSAEDYTASTLGKGALEELRAFAEE